jgi:phage shock protein A
MVVTYQRGHAAIVPPYSTVPTVREPRPMSMLDRLSRLISANLNDLLDRAEDPEKMLDQILRDMRSSISEARAQTVAMIAQEKELGSELDQTRRLAIEWGKKAAAAVKAGKDDLAREALRRRRDQEQNAELYAQQHQVQVQTVAKLKEQLGQLEAKYQGTLSHRDALIARQRRAKAQEQVAASLSTYTPYDPSAELDRMERQIRAREARAAAIAETTTDSWDNQFRALDDPEIEAELQLLKAGEPLAPPPALAGGARPEAEAPAPKSTPRPPSANSTTSTSTASCGHSRGSNSGSRAAERPG